MKPKIEIKTYEKTTQSQIIPDCNSFSLCTISLLSPSIALGSLTSYFRETWASSNFKIIIPSKIIEMLIHIFVSRFISF